MPQQARIVGIDISKLKVDACIRALQRRLSKPSTPAGQAELIAWLRQNGVGLAVIEASGGYERGWAEVLRRAGIAVRIVDPSGCAILPGRPVGSPRTIRSMPR
jgi:transposase